MFRAKLLLLAVFTAAACDKPPPPSPEPVSRAPLLTSVGPRVISNDTSYPLYLYGEHFVDGMELQVSEKRFAVQRLSDTLATATVAPLPVAPGISVGELRAKLVTSSGKSGAVPLKVVNNAGYPLPFDLEVIEGVIFVVSPNTDELWRYDTDGAPTATRVGDRPRALASWTHQNRTMLLVLHEYDGQLSILDPAAPDEAPRNLAVPRFAQDVAVAGDRAYVTSLLTDSVHVLDLVTGEEIAAFPCGVNPVALAVGGGKIAVSNLGSDDLVLLDAEHGGVTEVVVGPGAKIVGGHTAKYSQSVMGLKAPRDLQYVKTRGVFIASTTGPNTGPNEDRMAVAMNGGLSVVTSDGTFRHHVSMRRGTPQQFAVDEARGVVVVADVGTGRVVALNLDSVIAGREAVCAQIFADLPEGTSLLRPAAHYGTGGRNTKSMYAGPWALRLANGKAYVLNRFLGTVSEFDYADALAGTMKLRRTFAAPPLGGQKTRRAGEFVFFTDLGDTRQTCDGCHPEGHNHGVLFTNSEPMHIFRASSLRSISETAPYFTPAMLPSLASVAHVIGATIRANNFPLNTGEIRALGVFQRGLAPPPNPHFDGVRLPAAVTLPDGARGDPAVGAGLFAENCATCHPPPMFTLDQDQATRGKTFETGEVTIELRLGQQDDTPYPVPVPTLVGVWDNHPLFHGGQIGTMVKDGRVVSTRFALRDVLAEKSHFDASSLDEQAQNDLLAYVLTL